MEDSLLDQIVMGMLDSSNPHDRSSCEHQYQTYKIASPGLLAFALSRLFRSNRAFPNKQQLVAVLLRRALEDESPTGAWAGLGLKREEFRQSVLEAVRHAKGRAALRAGTHVVAQLSRLSFQNEPVLEWPELFGFMYSAAADGDAEMRENGFELFSSVAEYAPKAVTPHSLVIGQVLGNGLKDAQSIDVRLAAVRALASLMVTLQDPQQLAPFRPAIPMMMDALKSALDQAATQKDSRLEEVARESIKALVDIVTAHPKFLRADFQLLADSMLAIATAKALDSDTRCLGLEFLVAACESMPTFFRKHMPQFASQICPLAMRLMCEGINANPDMEVWEINQEEEETDFDEDDDPISRVAEDAIHRLATALGGKTVIGSVFPLIPQLLKDSSDWRRRRTGLQTLSFMAEGCSKKFYAKLDEVVHWCVQTMEHETHPRVRYAGVHLLGRLCMDFGDSDQCGGDESPTFQQKFTPIVLPALAKSLRDPSQRVRCHAGGALVHFFNELSGLTQTDVAPFFEPLLEGLLGLIESSSLNLKHEGLSAIAAVASVASVESFGRFYDVLMPIIMRIAASNEFSKSEKASSLKGNALECIAVMAKAVGRERFAAHAQAAMNLILIATRQGEDSTLRRHSLAAAVRVAGVVKEDFVPLLPEFMPQLLRGVQEDVNPTFIDPATADAAREQGFQVYDMDVRGEGTKALQINTEAVHEVSTCVYALYNFAYELGTGFAPFAPSAFDAIMPIVDCEWVDAARNVAIVALPHLLKCSKNNPPVADVMFKRAFTALLGRLEITEENQEAEEDDEVEYANEMESTMHLVESLVTMFRTCYESGGAKDNDPYLGKRVENFPPLFGTFMAGEDYDRAMLLMIEALQRRVEILVEGRETFKANEEDQDEATEERFNAKDESHYEVAERLMDAVGYMMKLRPSLGLKNTPAEIDAGIATIRSYAIPLAMSLTSEDAPLNLKRLGLCMLDDYVEFVSSSMNSFAEAEIRCVQICIECVSCDDQSLARAAVWGLGICATHAGAKFDDFVPSAVQALKHAVESRREILTKVESPDELFDYGVVVDNALSSLEKFARYRGPALTRAGIPPDAMMTMMFNLLPCSQDTEEARVVNVQWERYVGTSVCPNPDRWLCLLLDQLTKGFDAISHTWDEDDAFVCREQRLDLAQKFARGVAKAPQGMTMAQMTMLSELGAWFAKQQQQQQQ